MLSQDQITVGSCLKEVGRQTGEQNKMILGFSDLEHSLFKSTKKLREKPSYHSHDTAPTPDTFLRVDRRTRWFGHSFLVPLSLFCPLPASISLVGMERELPSAFLSPGSVSLFRSIPVKLRVAPFGLFVATSMGLRLRRLRKKPPLPPRRLTKYRGGRIKIYNYY